MIRRITIITQIFMLSFVFAGTAFADITAPSQPASGPGGSNYNYSNVMSETRGSGVNKYIIYEPSPRAGAALPVIALLHGFQANPDPVYYLDFINHLVKKGYIIIYPYYQNLFTPLNDYVINAGNAIADALNHIAANPSDHAQPRYDGDQMCLGIIGHSMGGVTTANLAATWQARSIPRPLAIMPMASGNKDVAMDFLWRTNPIDDNTYMLVVACSDDTFVMDTVSRDIWNYTSQIPTSRKDWVLVNSDNHGSPDSNDLMADHRAPSCYTVDSLDYYGFWKWGTALMNYTFYGTDGDYALDNTASQRFMGNWSDGQAVVEAIPPYGLKKHIPQNRLPVLMAGSPYLSFEKRD